MQSVVCICPTFGRFPKDAGLLNECVYWFTRQTYTGPMKLLIFNDCPEQKLNNSTPNVVVWNSTHRFQSLGEKYNMMVAVALADKADIILPWEDDDISLPDRVSTSVDMLSDADYWNPKCAYFENGKGAAVGLCSPDSVHHNTSAYRSTVFTEYEHSYPTDRFRGCRQDMVMDDALRHDPRIKINSTQKLVYVYRWGMGSVFGHLSGHSDPAAAYAANTGIPGEYTIKPMMYRDYPGDVWKHGKSS